MIERLVSDYRRAPVKHADEPGWRTDGHNGYAWLFCTETISLFRFRGSRSAQVAHQVLGVRRLRGVLVGDRYHADNHAPCARQYCYAHVLRDVEDLEKEFPNQLEIQRFVAALAPLLARAMHLRGLQLSAASFRQQAVQTRAEIEAVTNAPAQPPASQKIQNLFREKAKRLYHWSQDRRVPADNNRAERERRPLVIARKLSFGSQSEAGTRTRELLMNVLHTLRKRIAAVTAAFQRVLDRLAEDQTVNLYKLLFPCASSCVSAKPGRTEALRIRHAQRPCAHGIGKPSTRQRAELSLLDGRRLAGDHRRGVNGTDWMKIDCAPNGFCLGKRDYRAEHKTWSRTGYNFLMNVAGSVWLGEIVRYRRQEILDRPQQSFGREVIKQISFRWGEQEIYKLTMTDFRPSWR